MQQLRFINSSFFLVDSTAILFISSVLFRLDAYRNLFLPTSPLMDKYRIENSLASGSTGKVKIAKYLNKSFAIKIIDKTVKTYKEVQKEMRIQAMLSHKNIVKLIENYENTESYFMVMELAELELFDLIEPDVGLHPVLIHFYFRQLTSAVKYLHENGIVHRDIKPENIMLSKNGDLLLTDFGYSTVYMYKGRTRKLSSIVGSYSYMAPEVLKGEYNHLIDIWSMGVVLYVLYVGNVPWKRPVLEDDRFANYLMFKNHNYEPFTKMSPQIVKLFEAMCNISLDRRIDINELENHEWLCKKSVIENENGMCINKNAITEYLSTSLVHRTSFSQPGKRNARIPIGHIMSSQPFFKTFDLPMLKRIYLKADRSEIIHNLRNIFQALVIPVEIAENTFLFETVDMYGNKMTGEVVIEKINYCHCVVFTRIQGGCIEFKKLFNVIRDKLEDVMSYKN